MSQAETNTDSLLPDFNSAAALRHRHWRNITDTTTRYLMAIGGISVIIAIVLIAFYLLYVVLPMFKPADIELAASYQLPGNDSEESLYYAMEEQHEIGLRVTTAGQAIFFDTLSGSTVKQKALIETTDQAITAFSAGDPTERLLSLGLSDGTVVLASHNYRISYPNDVRLITPVIEFPLGNEPLLISPANAAIKHLTAQWDGEQATIVAVTNDSIISLTNFSREESFLSDEVEIIRTQSLIPFQHELTHVVLDIEQNELYIADAEGFISYYNLTDKTAPRLIQRVHAVSEDRRVSSLKFLGGGISILVGDSSGRIAQWFPVRDAENNYTLQHIRHFDSQKESITGIAAEYFRKGFLAIDKQGTVGIYHTTAHRTVKLEQISEEALTQLAVAPRANAMLVENNSGGLKFFLLDNEHPEISWQSIWGKVWYESREKAEFIWQSSSASSDFEPKFSLTPLAFGTLKAALYAMLFAVPLAIMGAIYTAYFMSARMRNVVKPTIEIMAALPTVILGFMAGLWFAPFIEQHLPGFFLVMLLVPLAILASARIWQSLPENLRKSVPDGWEAAILTPIIILAIMFSIWLSQPVELLLFDGNTPLWITENFGITYDQRNSLIVGIAIGFAVIPTIFSISEDAIYAVPRHLTMGSLALGATPWQTMIKVILLTASPGIFSAVMIGLGRAVGETMIVVMATGNTAIMDMNMFQGFRALSANIAVEMPEAEVNSTHYRILFLAGLVLFAATFVVNTVAELVRQRLREKYSSL
ncbi:MAG: ABC transporter permease subunit [Gammaproteobacteria bacterium]|jgi:phosphate transport system permease protein|nr:ABC transporter permease subunit [Gammaproteobacteria bacterium]